MARTHLIIGAGRMGGALINGWLRNGMAADRLILRDPAPGPAAQTAMDVGAVSDASLDDVDTVLLAVKPQVFAKQAAELGRDVPENALVVSIMAGTTLHELRGVFPTQDLVRAMPNTPSAIGAGITAYVAGNDGAAQRAETLLSPGGVVVRVDSEDMIDSVTAVSGSGPAYVFHMVEALAAAARDIGMDETQAATFARQTIVGAGALLAESEGTAKDLRIAVTSPKGTTEAGLGVLMDELPGLMRRTVRAALARARELGKG